MQLSGAIDFLNSHSLMEFVTVIPKLIVGLISLTAQFGFAEVKTLGFAGALELLNINPIMLAISALIAVVAGGVAIFNAVTTSTEEWRQKLSDSKSALSEAQQEATTLNDQLKTTQDRIDELNGKDLTAFAFSILPYSTIYVNLVCKYNSKAKDRQKAVFYHISSILKFIFCSLDSGKKSVGFVGFLPCEIRVWSAEMTVVAGLAIYRSAKVEILDYCGRTKVKYFHDGVGKL